MDLYTTSFSFPRSTPRSLQSSTSPHPTTLNLPGSSNLQTIPLPNVTSATVPPKKASSAAPLTTVAQLENDWQEVQNLVLDITSREGCLVTVTKEQIGCELGFAHQLPLPTGSSSTTSGEDVVVPATTVWNVHLSGGYQSVMAARGAILRELPRDNRTVLKVARAEVLESPLAPTSALKPDVKRRLDEIAADSQAHIAVLNIATGTNGLTGRVLATADGKKAAQAAEGENGAEGQAPGTNGDAASGFDVKTSGSRDSLTDNASAAVSGPSGSSDSLSKSKTRTTVTYGLETERMCELVITGSVESVEVAKVRLLVMLDEQVRGRMSFLWCMADAS